MIVYIYLKIYLNWRFKLFYFSVASKEPMTLYCLSVSVSVTDPVKLFTN